MYNGFSFFPNFISFFLKKVFHKHFLDFMYDKHTSIFNDIIKNTSVYFAKQNRPAVVQTTARRMLNQ